MSPAVPASDERSELTPSKNEPPPAPMRVTESPKIDPAPIVAKQSLADLPVPPPPPLPGGESLADTMKIAKADIMPPPAQIPEPTKTVESEPTHESTTPEKPTDAQQALKKFLAAPTWKERQKWSQRPNSIGVSMEKYYRSHPDGPVDVARVEFIERYPKSPDHPPYSMFEISGGSLKQTMLVLVEEPPGKQPRVDWETFVEFKDRLLWQFLIKPSTSPEKFRVQVRRKHAFDKTIPDIESKDSFELTLPGSDAASLVYASRDSAAAKVLTQQLAWGAMLPLIVELQWRNEGIKRWVEIKSIVAFGWRG
jgi:hypothetical protein